MPAPSLHSSQPKQPDNQPVCLFAQTNFRNQLRRFGIKVDDRRRHMYIIGKTGMGKSTAMENMMLHDIYSGLGVGLVDPHGDFAEKIIDFIPSWRLNDVVYLNPSDIDHPIGFNILEVTNPEQKHLVAAGLMGTFKKIWPDVWSSRMEYILNNTLLALLDYPGSTLLGINRLLSDKNFRNKVVRKLTDPVVKSFWQNEFASYEPRYAKEAVAPIQNKIGQFLSASVIRNMVAQVKSTVNIREIMDSGKILIMNLSKGRIGEDNSRLLGGMLITKIQLAAMERVDMPEDERKDFFLYVDEFQNFATPSFANILSEARKYHLGLVMAHQYVAQLDEVVADAVFGNVGTIVSFRVGAGDAEYLAKEFAPTFTEEDIVNLPKFHIFLKLMIDGVASQPFSATTMPPIAASTGSTDKVIKVSRERYAKTRASIEEKILRWSGMEETTDDDVVQQSKQQGKKQQGQKKSDRGKDGKGGGDHKKTSSHKSGNKGSKTERSESQKESPAKKPKPSEPEAKKEAPVSLTSLPSRAEVTREEKKKVSEKKPENESMPKEAVKKPEEPPTSEPKSEEVPKVDPKAAETSAPMAHKPAKPDTSKETTQEEPKKKRKRRRKKKSVNTETIEQPVEAPKVVQTEPPAPVVPPPALVTPPVQPPPQQPPAPPQPMQPGNVIRFDS